METFPGGIGRYGCTDVTPPPPTQWRTTKHGGKLNIRSRNGLGRVTRVLAAIAAAIVASVGISVATASPAAASPYWQTYSVTADWECTAKHFEATNLLASSCIVVNGAATQPVIIATNSGTAPVTLFGATALWANGDFIQAWPCNETVLNPGHSRACFGATTNRACNWYVQGQAQLWVNGVDRFWFSPTQRMCR
jgi:hypothetical protein